MTKRILVADDDPGIADPLAHAFRREGYEADIAYDGEHALRLALRMSPDVVLLDVVMPKLTGYEVCRKLAGRAGMGIILLTAKSDVADKIVGLEMGADDYMTKPFELRELMARVKALLRRMEIQQAVPAPMAWGPLLVDPVSRTAELEGQPVTLTPKEFELLAILLGHPERVFTRDELLDRIWGFEYAAGTRTVDIHMQRLRRKLGPACDGMLQTVFGVGYKASGSGAR